VFFLLSLTFIKKLLSGLEPPTSSLPIIISAFDNFRYCCAMVDFVAFLVVGGAVTFVGCGRFL